MDVVADLWGPMCRKNLGLWVCDVIEDLRRDGLIICDDSSSTKKLSLSFGTHEMNLKLSRAMEITAKARKAFVNRSLDDMLTYHQHLFSASHFNQNIVDVALRTFAHLGLRQLGLPYLFLRTVSKRGMQLRDFLLEESLSISTLP
jgi:hypothetical protein